LGSLPAPVRYIPAWTIAVNPTANLKSSRPRPGHPDGKVEKSLCRRGLLCDRVRRSPSRQITGCNWKANHESLESFYTTFEVSTTK
jgi:hypothetical protein